VETKLVWALGQKEEIDIIAATWWQDVLLTGQFKAWISEDNIEMGLWKIMDLTDPR